MDRTLFSLLFFGFFLFFSPGRRPAFYQEIREYHVSLEVSHAFF